MTSSVDSFTLLAVPFFVLAGNLMNTSGMTDRIFEFARRLLGHMHGGLAHVNIGASMLFAGMSGAALADLAGLGAVEMKAMRENGYSASFATALTLASCTIGVIIPPSISFIVYSLVTGESIGRLFVAGIVPGLMIGITLMTFVYVWARMGSPNFLPPEPFRPAKLVVATRRAGMALLLPVLILSSLLLGIATPTEVGVIACLYALAMGVVYREQTWKGLWRTLVESATTTALIMYIVAVASVMGWVVTSERSAHDAAQAIAESVGSPDRGAAPHQHLPACRRHRDRGTAGAADHRVHTASRGDGHRHRSGALRGRDHVQPDPRHHHAPDGDRALRRLKGGRHFRGGGAQGDDSVPHSPHDQPDRDHRLPGTQPLAARPGLRPEALTGGVSEQGAHSSWDQPQPRRHIMSAESRPTVDVTRQLAEMSASLSHEALPDEVRYRTRLFVLDGISVMLGAVGFAASNRDRCLEDYLDMTAPSGNSTVVGTSRRTSPMMAAFANGTMSEVLDCQDTNIDCRVHNGAAIIPAALVMAEETGAGDPT